MASTRSALPAAGLAAAFGIVLAAAVALYLPKRPRAADGPAKADPVPGRGIDAEKPEAGPPPVPPVPDTDSEERREPNDPGRAKLEAPAPLPLPGSPRMAHLVPAEWPAIEFAPPPALAVAPPPARIEYARMSEESEADLRRELEGMREVALYEHFTAADAKTVDEAKLAAMRQGAGRPDLKGLPLLMGAWCKLSPTAANTLQEGSTAMRGLMRTAVPRRGADPDERVLSTSLERGISGKAEWLKPEAIPALQQMLMGEETATRGLLVGQLARIDGKWATMALAQRAVVDPSPRLREQALRELATRDPKDYVPLLLSAMAYPWPAVARHAAEALGALRRTEALPGLLRLLDGPSPERPYAKPGKGLFVREMVKVNHMRGCLLCHAVSTGNEDPVRGLVPLTDRPPAPAYYAASAGTFVRADITYIRQDFSLPMDVKEPGLWAKRQRFDFLTRERKTTRAEAVPMPGITTAHQQAMLYAIRTLTGKDHGPKADDWRGIYLGKDLAPRVLSGRIVDGVSLAIDAKGRALILDGGIVLRKDGTDKPEELFRARDLSRLAGGGAWGIASGKVVRIEGGKLSPLGKAFAAPRRLAADGSGGAYLTDGAVGERRGALWHLRADGKATKLAQPFADPRALALSPDGARLYVAGASGHDAWAFTVASPGKLGEAQRITRHGTTGAGRIVDLAVDAEGNVCVFDAESSTVTVANPAGARLASAQLSRAPVSGAVFGRTAYALTRGELVAVPIDIEPLRGIVAKR